MNFVNLFKITFKASERMFFLGFGNIYVLRLALNKSLYPFLDCKILARQLSGASNLLRIIIKITNQFIHTDKPSLFDHKPRYAI